MMKQNGNGKFTEKGKIWIDLDNSPHVPFFIPIIEELQKRSYSIVLTARDCFQVRDLADLFHLNCKLIGHHSGKGKLRKMAVAVDSHDREAKAGPSRLSLFAVSINCVCHLADSVPSLG